MNAPLAPSPRAGRPAPADPALDALPALIDRAAQALATARTSADVLDAAGLADVAYTAAKSAARLLKMRGAHDAVVAAALRVQGDALLIEAEAKIRLADEYEAARDRGEVARQGQRTDLLRDSEKVPTLAEIGLSHSRIFVARQIRDAVRREPGILSRLVEERLTAGRPPTKDAIEAGVAAALRFDSEADLDAHVRRRRAEKQALKVEKRVDLSLKLAESTRAAAAELGRTLYPVVYVDFPWRTETWSDATGMDRAADNH